MPVSLRVVQGGLFLVAAIAIAGGTLRFVLGQPDTSPRLGSVHRFMAGVSFSTGLIAAWAAWTIGEQGTLVYLLALGVLPAPADSSRSRASAWPSRARSGSATSFPGAAVRDRDRLLDGDAPASR